ncbi:hypothetical protein AB0N36_43065 [Streptomyces acidicola]
MAVIHCTTLKPTKLELLTSWLPSRPWYGGAGAPEPARAGGFRLDDPDGSPLLPEGATGHVGGTWQLPDGTRARGLFAMLHTSSRS